MSYYKILGVERQASFDDIRRAYLKGARTHHPDKNPDEKTSELFQKILNAYEVLYDPVKRREYDAELLQESQKSMPSPYTSPSTEVLNPENLPKNLIDLIECDALNLFLPYLNQRQLRAVLIFACQKGKCNIAQAILNKHPELIQLKVAHFGIKGSLLSLAIASGNVELVRHFFAEGLPIDEECILYDNNSGYQAQANHFYLAASRNDLEMVKELRKHTRSWAGNVHFTPLLIQVIANGSIEMVESLLSLNVVWSPDVVMPAAINRQSLPMVKLFCRYKSLDDQKNMWNPARIVVSGFGLEKVKELILKKEFNPFEKIDIQETDREVMLRLFKAIGYSVNFKVMEYFESQFEQVRAGMRDGELQSQLLIAVIKACVIDNKKFEFIASFRKKTGFSACTPYLSEIEKAVYQRGTRWTAFIYSLKAIGSFQKLLERIFDHGIQNLEVHELRTLLALTRDVPGLKVVYSSTENELAKREKMG